jgi:ribosomal protein L37AE/L43A
MVIKEKRAIRCVKIKCPKCKSQAELASDFSLVRCQSCELELTYGEYVKYVAHNDVTYSDILSDYATETAGQNAGTLDEWD